MAKTGNSKSSTALAISGRFDIDGKGYVVKEDGSNFSFSADVESSSVTTQDRAHTVVMVTGDNTINVYDENGELVTELKDSYKVRHTSNAGFVYNSQNTEDSLKYFRFEDGQSLEIAGPSEDVTGTYFSYYTEDALIVMDDALYLWNPELSEPEKIQTVKNDHIDDYTFSKDGSAFIWADMGSDGTDIYGYADGNVNKLCSFDDDENVYAFISDDNKDFLVMMDYGDCLIKGTMDGKDNNKIKLKHILSYSNIYTLCNGKDSLLLSGGYSSSDTLYLANGDSVYAITADGDREKIISDIKENDGFAGIRNGMVAYIDDEDDLYVGKVSGTEISDETKIASDVLYAAFSGKNGLYYYKNYEEDDNIADYYYCTVDGKVNEKVTSEVDVDNIRAADNGKSIYFKDVEEIEGSYTSLGALYLASGSNGIKIDSDVIYYSIRTFNEYGYDKFTYIKYDHTDEASGAIIGSLYYFNGEETEKIASDVIHYRGDLTAEKKISDADEEKVTSVSAAKEEAATKATSTAASSTAATSTKASSTAATSTVAEESEDIYLVVSISTGRMPWQQK